MKEKSIDDILMDFADSYVQFKKLSNNLTMVLHGKWPVIREEDADDLACGIVTSEDYIGAMARAVKGRDAVSALRIYSSTASELYAMIESRRSTIKKLVDRIFGGGSSDNELKVCEAKKAKYTKEINTLCKCLADTLERFFRLRQSVILKIAEFTRSLAESDIPTQTTDALCKKYALPLDKFAKIDKGFLKGLDE